MGASVTKTFLLGGCVLLGAWGISHLNQPKSLPPVTPKQEAISYPIEQPEERASNDLPARGKYHYVVTISDARRDWETYEQQTLINGEVRLKKTSSDISEINGTYIWDMDEYLPTEEAMFNYILSNYSRMKQYKVQSTPSQKSTSSRKCDADEYNDRLDEYLADPEDESEFPPEIFDFLQD